MSKRWFAAALTAVATSLHAEARSSLFNPPLPDVAGKAFTTLLVDLLPGERVALPQRGDDAAVHVYVLLGAVDSTLDGARRRYREGEGWREMPGDRPATASNASATESARLLFILVGGLDE